MARNADNKLGSGTESSPQRKRWLAAILAIPVTLGAAFGIVWWRGAPEREAKRAADLAAQAKQGANRFLRCVANDQADVDLWSKSDLAVKDLIAKYYPDLSRRMGERCLPLLNDLDRDLGKHGRLSADVSAALGSFQEAVGNTSRAASAFVSKAKEHDEEQASFQKIVDNANNWDAAPVAADAAPFERFFVCAIPKAVMDSGDDLFHFFANTCVHGDPLGFMRTTARQCGGILRGDVAVGAGDSSAVRKFHGYHGLMKLGWSGCAKDAYKVWIASDGGPQLVGSLADLRGAGTRLAAAAFKSVGS
jgi:hypothetical protein